MKKILTLLLIFTSISVLAFSEQYRITDVEYTTVGAGFNFLGKTKPSSIRQKFPVDKKKIFDSQEALENYIQNYQKELESSRNFETVEINYTTSFNAASDINEVSLSIHIQDSHHLVVAPYPKYKTGDGATLKLKAKDTNFLGSLNTMNTSLSLKLDEEKGFIPQISFDFDYPFELGNISATLINDYGLSYVVSDDEAKSGFEWSTKTGLSFSIPFDKLPLNFGLYQYTNGDLDYRYYENDSSSYKFKDNEDYKYFGESVSVGTSVKIKEFSNYTTLSYSPSVSVKWNWDFDGINKENGDLSSPTLTFSHSLSNSKITWNDNMRKGYKLSLANSYSYNFQRQDLYPSLSFSGQFFWNYKANEQEYWNRYGLCSNFYAFYNFKVSGNKHTKQQTSSFYDELRGLLSKNTRSYPIGFYFNFDLPHNVFTTDITPKILNFNLQIAPFFDMALGYDKDCGRAFNLYDDGYYCAGVEFLVYPLKWSSITARASLGVDLKGAAKDANFLEAISNNKEIFIGIGLHY